MNGQWTGWSAWFGCSVTCGSGQKMRQRSCSNPGPSNGGQNCPGVDSETMTCNAGTCPGTLLKPRFNYITAHTKCIKVRYHMFLFFKKPVKNLYI